MGGTAMVASDEAIHNLCTLHGMVATQIPVFNTQVEWVVRPRRDVERGIEGHSFCVGRDVSLEGWVHSVEDFAKAWAETAWISPTAWRPRR